MKVHKLVDFKRGWFVGDFCPSLFVTKDFEVAIQCYSAGDTEQEHIHRIATEITAIVDGQVKINGTQLSAGDVVVIQPNEKSKFEAITDAKTVVVKSPSVPNDKYLLD